MIEKNAWSGLFDFYDALIKALQVECEETITSTRKGRRRQRSVTTKPTLLTVDQIPGFARGTYIYLYICCFKKILYGL